MVFENFPHPRPRLAVGIRFRSPAADDRHQGRDHEDDEDDQIQPVGRAVSFFTGRVLGIGATFAMGEQLTTRQKTQLSAGAVGAAVGLAVSYGIGRFRP